MITTLAGGVGAARFLRGLCGATEPSTVNAVVNTGDDMVLHGLHISPDLDTVAYTLGGRSDVERGWGLAGETWAVMEALESLGGASWFRLGDRDLATHLYRTQRLSEGAALHEVIAELATHLGVAVRLLPMSDDAVRTRLTLAGGPEVDFQDYFVRRQHAVAVEAVRFVGAEAARPAPGVIEAIAEAHVVVICPSNPVVSIGPILAVPGVRAAVAAVRARVVAVSPIVAGAALRGAADRLLAELGHEVSVVGVARLYADVASVLVVDEADRDLVGAVEATGVRCVVTDTVMRDLPVSVALARTALAAVGDA